MLKEVEQVKYNLLDFDCDSKQLKDVLVEYLSRKSKFIRSDLSILLLSLANIDIKNEHIKLCMITEMIHNASLIHDDIIDASDIRRNKPTLNAKYSSKFAVIAGDFLISRAVKELIKFNNSGILNLYLNTISAMCVAESDQYFMKGQIPTIEQYLLKTKAKTANLFIVLVKSLLLFSNTKNKRLVDFAEVYGTAFQIKNDLDNFLSDQSDVNNGIYTAPYIYSNVDKNISIEKTFALIHNYLIRGKEILGTFPDNEYKRELEDRLDSLCKLKR